MEIEIIEGDMILVTNDKEADWWSVDEIDVTEDWIPNGGPEDYVVKNERVFWCSNKDGKFRAFTKGDIDRHEPTGRR